MGPLDFRETWVGEIFEFDQMYWPQGSWICRKNPGFPLQSYDRLEWDVSTINPNRIFGRGFLGILRVESGCEMSEEIVLDGASNC